MGEGKRAREDRGGGEREEGGGEGGGRMREGRVERRGRRGEGRRKKGEGEQREQGEGRGQGIRKERSPLGPPAPPRPAGERNPGGVRGRLTGPPFPLLAPSRAQKPPHRPLAEQRRKQRVSAGSQPSPARGFPGQRGRTLRLRASAVPLHTKHW